MNLLLTDRGNGGELVLNNGDLAQDNTHLTAIYLSLFTGDCFYNVFEDYKTSDEFEELMNLPATMQNLRKLETCAKELLKWMPDEEIVDNCDVFAYSSPDNKMNIDVTLTEPDGINVYSIVWQNDRLYLQQKS